MTVNYNSSPLHFGQRILQVHGSVIWKSLVVALPIAAISAIFKALTTHPETKASFAFLVNKTSVLQDTAPWNGFGVLVGFLIIFRTSQAQTRFADGCTACYRLRSEFFDACSQILAFSRKSKSAPEAVQKFEDVIVKLFSMLHAVAYADVADSTSKGNHTGHEVLAQTFVVLGPIDDDSLQAIKESHCKTQLVYQWIHNLVTENMDNGILPIPAPCIGSVFMRLANALSSFHDAQRISHVQFPFPYVQVCDALMILHLILTPFLVATWANDPGWAFAFGFVQVFIIWALNFIAIEIEAPFGSDANDLDTGALLKDANRYLVTISGKESKRLPHLPSSADVARHDDFTLKSMWDLGRTSASVRAG